MTLLSPLNMTALLLAATLALTACQSSDGNAQEAKATASASPAAAKIINVETLTLKPQPFNERIDLTGKVEPWKQAIVSSEIGGKLEWIGLVEGRVIGQGAVAARVNATLLAAQKEQAEANYNLSLTQEKWQKRTLGKQVAVAESTFGNTGANFRRQQQLFKQEVVSEQAIDDAATNFRNSELNLDLQKITRDSGVETNRIQTVVAAANAKVARANYSKAFIYSPISGYINHVDVEAGEVVNPGQALAEVMQINRVKVNAGVPERDIAAIKVGQVVNVRFDAYPNRTFSGTILFIGASADNASKTFPVKIQIENPELLLKPGMIGHLSLSKADYPNSIVVPLDAVIEQEAGRIVYVAENGKAVARPVELAQKVGSRARITQGLKAGEQLIVFGHRDVLSGDQIKITKQRVQQ